MDGFFFLLPFIDKRLSTEPGCLVEAKCLHLVFLGCDGLAFFIFCVNPAFQMLAVGIVASPATILNKPKTESMQRNSILGQCWVSSLQKKGGTASANGY